MSTAGVLRPLAVTGLVVALLYAVADRLVESVLHWHDVTGQVAEIAFMAVLSSSVLWAGVLRPLSAQVARERHAAEARQQQIETTASQQKFEASLHRALEMAGTEEAAYRTTEKALRMATPTADSELMLADSSQAHLKRVVAASEGGRAACGVTSPHDCPAVRRATTLVFRSSEDLDACPFLEGRPGGAVSAACVPMSVAGRSIGVLHTVGDDGNPPCGGQLERLEAIATHSGSRIGMLRVMAATTLQAATDPLTGLLNRRSLENRVHELNRRGVPFALAMGDLDHFKRLNDTHGHDAGDRALRLFARTMTRVLRSEDLICRFGGEEFVVAFPDRPVQDAVRALERLQEELLLALVAGNTPDFTVSFGVAHSHDASSFEELCRVADTALFRAKREGRNRVVADQGVTTGQAEAAGLAG